jgi:hypothetical protein
VVILFVRSLPGSLHVGLLSLCVATIFARARTVARAPLFVSILTTFRVRPCCIQGTGRNTRGQTSQVQEIVDLFGTEMG